ncbi:MAG: hypothetical protein AAFY83_11390 [Pseudomonadota bacterium]
MDDFGIIIAILAVISSLIVGLVTVGRRPVRWYDALMALPLVSVIALIIFATYFAPPGTCGSEEPGDCFGYAILVGFFIGPLGLITTPLLIILLFRRERRS